ncbi:MAG: PHP-associated domain-containing protein [Chloroflexota bacterium]
MNPIYSKADIHMHTTCSDGLMTPEALVEYVVANTDFKVIAVTDHETIEGAQIAKAYADHFADDFGGLEVIIGSEIRSADAEILALFIEEDIPPGLSGEETIERIHAQRGLAIAAHPYSFIFGLMGKVGMIGAQDRIRDLPFDAVEVINGTPTELFTNPYTRFRNRQWANLPETGGSDAHYIRSLGATYTQFPGSTAEDLRQAIINGQVKPGGRIYNPFLIFNLWIDAATHQIPVKTLPPERAADWQRVRETVLQGELVPAL